MNAIPQSTLPLSKTPISHLVQRNKRLQCRYHLDKTTLYSAHTCLAAPERVVKTS